MGRPLEDVVSEQLSLLYDVYLEHYPRRALSWFWSHLNEMQCFDFDLADVKLRHFFTAHSLDFLGQQPVLKVILLQSAFVAFCTVIYALFNNRPRRAPELPDSPRLRAPLNALLNFLTPTTSIWPEFYLHIAQCGLINRSAQLNIPLMQLLRELLHGDTELRYPTADLPSFISNTHSSDGWRIKPSVEIYWHVYVAFQIIRLRLSRLSPLPRRPTFSPSLRVPHPSTPASVSLSGVTNRCDDNNNHAPSAIRTLSSGMATLVLDAVPYANLSSYIRSVQHSLPLGSSAMLGFSTYGDAPSFTSSAYVQAAIPFFARQYVTKKNASSSGIPTSARCPSLAMEPTPLLTSLDGILRLILSGPAPLAVESVQNVSEQYASYLDRYVHELANLPKVRDKFVTQWGLAGWREERLLVTWEAALFRAGLMVRWVVLVTRTEHA